jgi:hypothetical protein
MKKIAIIFFFLSFSQAFGQSIFVKGAWYVKIDPNLITNAGLDYDPNLRIESLANQTVFNLENNFTLNKVYSAAWRIDVQKIDSNWPSELRLAIQRTSAGKSPNLESITGGTVYQYLNSSPQTLFQGKGIVAEVALKYAITGLSVLIPVDTYSTSVVFTLIEE